MHVIVDRYIPLLCGYTATSYSWLSAYFFSNDINLLWFSCKNAPVTSKQINILVVYHLKMPSSYMRLRCPLMLTNYPSIPGTLRQSLTFGRTGMYLYIDGPWGESKHIYIYVIGHKVSNTKTKIRNHERKTNQVQQGQMTRHPLRQIKNTSKKDYMTSSKTNKAKQRWMTLAHQLQSMEGGGELTITDAIIIVGEWVTTL